MSKLVINDLHVEIEGKEILKGVNLEVNSHEIHAIMGPNGNGKSTLLSTIMGHPTYTVTKGSITFDGQDVLEMEVDERSRAGIFQGMQYPQEVSGVTNSDFMKAAINARREEPVGLFEFVKKMEGAIDILDMKEDLAHRFLNEGFSGGEKKRNEILQMMLLEPKIAMLDEIDSGLDIDALGIVAKAIKEMADRSDTGMMIVSHYERFFQQITPTHTHIMIDGKIVVSSDGSLVNRVDAEGYDWIKDELGIDVTNRDIQANAKPRVSLQTCAVNEGTKNVD
ncbi:MAG: Fe-S cluster assembly ATPase SufC [Erysipelothrix sp.]|nr:Fe-S cluster assembly ATPase SufC [Erysipelothrix sp.]